MQAYKGLHKEKDALEKSLKVLGPGSKSSLEGNSSSVKENHFCVEQTRDQETCEDGTPATGVHSPSDQPINISEQGLEDAATQDEKV